MTRKNYRFVCALLVITLILFSSGIACGQADREDWQPPEKIMDVIGVKAGMKIGEAGAGSGYFTFPLSKRVGEKGSVFANDISKRGLNRIKSRAEREDITNIRTVVGEVEDPSFPEKNLDMIIMVYVIHHLDKPVKFLNNLEKYLKRGASVVVIEQDPDKTSSARNHFWTQKQVRDKVEESNFRVEKIETFLKKDSIYILKAKN